ncbi:(deoxy)nucleoside triphosphate pyrophosphohydrolase [Lachnoclostridium phytofermentans]|uniref:8-oxo-dGTP diphosphatase n=1 Tax=Lachnoclostridium phytofermentans (strain ATCC 700394 / DSM 18823 / ISDg) TaxID=357809 RepID=A9KQS6_LACP7|nr:(deoxy)nucleoside triphosphate pyrophosphohydrolase [Lachnoclostridium phytofermentans]ABX41989.1 NUDIX hydrolase [Lachnoclostridium phytofermentans ISDg]
MKTIKVVAAIIVNNKRILATQRGYGDFKGGWEFPGGKIEEAESSEVALRREIKEELDIDIEIIDFLTTVEYTYPNFHLSMQCYFCGIKAGEVKLLEHEASKWLAIEELDSVLWLPADIEVVEKIKESYLNHN